mmetsp:Transcript_17016/g.20467  ORF Transcript_17016/g.20467 Transcript_17016/m.20467 type:complete len:273 (+) Transcript_17016:26-844(+)
MNYKSDSPNTLNDINVLLINLIEKKPFMYAHFNDGELKAMMSNSGKTDRGWQNLSYELQQKLRNAVRLDVQEAYIGIPCYFEFREAHNQMREILGKPAFSRITSSTIWINRNYNPVRRILGKILTRLWSNSKHKIYFVCPENTNTDNFVKTTGILLEGILRIPSTNAFPEGYYRLKDQTFPDGSLVILTAGPLGRILASEWFERMPKVTFLEMGSFWDHETHGWTRAYNSRKPEDYYFKPCMIGDPMFFRINEKKFDQFIDQAQSRIFNNES